MHEPFKPHYSGSNAINISSVHKWWLDFHHENNLLAKLWSKKLCPNILVVPLMPLFLNPQCADDGVWDEKWNRFIVMSSATQSLRFQILPSSELHREHFSCMSRSVCQHYVLSIVKVRTLRVILWFNDRAFYVTRKDWRTG